MAELKTKATDAGVEEYLAARANEQQAADCKTLMAILMRVTGHQPTMWGPSIVGYGSYRYTYESGRTGEMCLVGFAIRGRELVVYLATDGPEQQALPEPQDTHRLARAAADLRIQDELDGTPLAPERLHITLHAIAVFTDTIPQAIVDAAIAASAGVVCPPLPIVFDHVVSFTESNAFVLRCNPDGDAAVARLRQSLALRLRRAGLRPEPSRTPHMTMLYDRRHITPHAIEPICWTATRFALVLSHVGIGHHQWIAQWPLKDRP